MIEPMEWQQPGIGETWTPFMRGRNERPLRITLHSESFCGKTPDEAAAVLALRDLREVALHDGRNSPLRITDTVPSSSRWLQIGSEIDRNEYVRVDVFDGDRLWSRSGIPDHEQWPRVAAGIIGQAIVSPVQPDTEAMLRELLVAQASMAIQSDLLVTGSRLLLDHRDDSSVSLANPRSPLEAARIVGLFLRSREDYRCGRNYQMYLSEGMFHLVLARHRMPSMWAFLHGCQASSKFNGDDCLGVAWSIINRCVRALEARDAIGREFYSLHNNGTRDRMMYHFDYLTLLLSGALDAAALIAHRAYRLPIPERQAGARSRPFRQALQQSGSASILDSVMGAQPFQDLMTLLYEPRNTIHKARMNTVGGGDFSSHAIVPTSIAKPVWEAANRLGGVDRWGLRRHHGRVEFDPYSFSSCLCDESIAAVNSVAGATDVSRLSPGGLSIPPLSPAIRDHPFDQVTGDRVGVLG